MYILELYKEEFILRMPNNKFETIKINDIKSTTFDIKDGVFVISYEEIVLFSMPHKKLIIINKIK